MKQESILILIFETIQLPIVFLIILASYNFVSLSVGFDKERSTLRNRIKNNPLSFTSIAFCINFIYLLYKIATSMFFEGIENKVVENKVVEIVLDTTTTFFFLIASIDIFFNINKRKKNGSLSGLLSKKNISYILILVVYLYITLHGISIRNTVKEDYFSYIYNFVGYTFVGIYIFKQITSNEFGIKKTTTVYFASGGFILWGLIQLLPSEPERWALWGFILSFCSKVFIFYGFYNFYIQYAKIISKKQLNEKSNLESLQKLINDVSNSTTIDDLAKKVCNHLTNKKVVFHFDYAIFSEVDYLKRVIRNKYAWEQNTKIKFPKEWVVEKGIDLGDKDILSVVVRNKKTVHINGLEIDSKKYTINELSCPLNWDVFTKYEHIDLNRAIIPLLDLQQKHDSDPNRKVVALIEVGYHNTTEIAEKESIDKNKELSIYLDNCYQTYERLLEKEVNDGVNDMIIRSNQQSGDEPIKFLESALNNVCEYTRAEIGLVALYPLVQNDIDTNIYFSDCSLSTEERKRIVEIINSNEVINENLGKGYSNKLNRQKEELFKITGTNHLRIEKLMNEYYIGLIILFSQYHIPEAEAANGTNAGLLDSINKEVDSFLKKAIPVINTYFDQNKFHNAVKKLAHPTDIANEDDLEKHSHYISGIIKDYFNCDAISIWLKSYENEKQGYKQIALSKGVSGCYYKGNLLEFNEKKPSFVPISLEKQSDDNAQFWKFASERGYKTMIYVPLIIDGQYYGFFNIYSYRANYIMNHKDIQLLKLISNKYVFSLAASRTISNYFDISALLNKSDLKEVLNKIVHSAREILHSEPVILFLTDEFEKIQYNQTIHAGYLYDKKKIYEDSRSQLLENIVSDKKEDFSATKVKQKNDFQKREKVESTALIPLVHDNKTIGVMCFNYRKEITFTETSEKFIRSFSEFATSAIVNADNIKKLNEKHEKIKFEYEDVYQKMNAMLPTATRNSLLDIIRQINHDIINHLLMIRYDIISIDMNAQNWIKLESDRQDLKRTLKDLDLNIARSNDLVKLFKPNAFKESEEDLNELIRSVSKLFNNKYAIDGIETEMAINLKELSKNDMPLLRCSKAEIVMILYNLISNAEKALREKIKLNKAENKIFKGLIKIQTSFDSQKYFNVSITDNGIGIDKEDSKEAIYQPGFTSRESEIEMPEIEKVHGMGLYFVKEAIEKNYGGTIECDSYKGKGTTFTLRFKQIVSYKN